MLIDLSVQLNADTPVFPGDPELVILAAGSFEKEGYLGHGLSMGTHSGTHIDAPAHMIEGSKTLDEFPVDRFVGPGRYIPLTDNRFDLGVVRAAGIQAGDIVIFNTGMSTKYYERAYFTDFPVMSEAVAQYLVECGVKMLGVDACSVDNSPAFPVHKILSGSDILILENLTNLDQLSDTEFTVTALPIKLNLDGAPARVIAEVKQ